jgi:8-oxo-dGTP diphosphatase
VITVVAAVIEEGGRFLVTRRQKGVHLAGLWEFPGGKIDEGETHAAAVVWTSAISSLRSRTPTTTVR